MRKDRAGTSALKEARVKMPVGREHFVLFAQTLEMRDAEKIRKLEEELNRLSEQLNEQQKTISGLRLQLQALLPSSDATTTTNQNLPPHKAASRKTAAQHPSWKT